MADNYMQDIIDVNLNSGSIYRGWLAHSIGTGDNKANRFGVRVFRDGLPVDLTGVSCQGYFHNSNGDNIALTTEGTVVENVAFVELPQACYSYEGQFTLVLKLVGGGHTTTVRVVDGMVDNTFTGSPVAPTTSVPTYQEIIAQYEAMQEATEDAEKAFADVPLIEGSLAKPATSYSRTNNYYIVLPEALEVGKVYRLAVKSATGGTYSLQAGTEAVASSMVDDILTDEAFVANMPIYALYTPSTTGIRYFRISSEAVTWYLDIAEIVNGVALAALEANVAELNTTTGELVALTGNTTLPTTAQTLTGAIAEHEGDITRLDGTVSDHSAEILHLNQVVERVPILQVDVDGLKAGKVNIPRDQNLNPFHGTAGQVLRTNGDGSTTWVNVGTPTDVQTEAAINAWLNAHPDATTTVQDGSLTAVKFSDALKLKTIKDYVCPELFGAVGDGETNDVEAFLALGAFCENKADIDIYFAPGKTYYIDMTGREEYAAMTLQNVQTLRIIGNNAAVHMKSLPENNLKYFLQLWEHCHDVEISGFRLYSEYDQTATPYGTHTRVNSIGSNVTMISICNVDIDTVRIRDMQFEYSDVAIDVIGRSTDLVSKSKNIFVENVKSYRHAMGVYTAYCENVRIRDCEFTGAEEYGDGDHHVYIRGNAKNVIIENVKGTSDKYFGNMFQFYPETGEARYTDYNVILADLDLVGAAISTFRNGIHATLRNINFTDASGETNPTSIPAIGLYNEAKILICDSVINGRNLILGGNSTAEVEVVNVTINNDAIDCLTDAPGAKFTFRNCNFTGKRLVALASGASRYLFDSCKVKATASSSGYLITDRSATAEILMMNCFVDMGSLITAINNNSVAAADKYIGNAFVSSGSSPKIGTVAKNPSVHVWNNSLNYVAAGLT